MEMEKNMVFGLEGLDGTGKTTVGKILAEETGWRYVYFTDHSKLAPLRRYFEHAPIKIRFLYYVGASIENYLYVEEIRKVDDVYLDRTIFSTIAYHRAYGVPKSWTSFIPKFLQGQFNRIIFFEVSDDERRKRLGERNAISDVSTQQSDNKSITLAARINKEYHMILPQGTIFVNTDSKTPRQVVDEIRGQIPQRR